MQAIDSHEQGTLLLELARSAMAHELGHPHPDTDTRAPWLRERGACFVTLTLRGELRGCIGTLQAHRSLLDDLRANAVAAALRDPRFAPVAAQELDRIEIEVSLLSHLQAMAFSCEAEAVAALRPGLDGVVLEFGGRHSTFLPQVWEQLPQAGDFLFQLKRKAGLPGTFWHDSVRLHRYTVTQWKEREPRPTPMS